MAQGRYVRVSEDHKPDRADERRAVEARGGQVIFRGTYRVSLCVCVCVYMARVTGRERRGVVKSSFVAPNA